MLPPFNLPEGIVLLITDELASPADFVLHRILASHIKEAKGSTNIIISVSGDIQRWKTIAAKSNVNLIQHIASGAVEFLNVSEHTRLPENSQKGELRPLYEFVKNKLSQTKESSALVILDDISTLEWIGFPFLDLTRFIRALRATCLEAKATLLIRHHIVTSNDPDDLFRLLLQICSYHMEVRPLSTGRSGAVSGEVALHPGPSTINDSVKLIPRSAAVQYRLADTGPTFFQRGTSAGVL
ncbi:hypothetical protein BDQ17DRAFT_1308433 [Cyathus striatus]|nr:hypothetical protein BDQ17DRAFT_1308433 [Cyathus striatus]